MTATLIKSNSLANTILTDCGLYRLGEFGLHSVENDRGHIEEIFSKIANAVAEHPLETQRIVLGKVKAWNLVTDYLSESNLKTFSKRYFSKFLDHDPIEFFACKDIFAMEDPIPLVEGLISSEENMILWGPSTVGKTFFMLDLCIKIANGLEWAGRKTRPTKMVYAYLENIKQLKKRLKAANVANGFDPEETHEGKILFMRKPVRLADPSREPLYAFLDALKATGFQPGVLVLDTVAKTLAGANENDAATVAELASQSLVINRSLECGVWGIHHTRKDEEEFRGSYSFKADFELMISVMPTVGTGLKVNFDKLKDEDDTSTFYFQRRKDEDFNSCFMEFTGAEARTQTAPKNVLPSNEPSESEKAVLLRLHPDGLAAVDWQRSVCTGDDKLMSSGTFYKVRKRAEDHAWVIVPQKGSKGIPYTLGYLGRKYLGLEDEHSK